MAKILIAGGNILTMDDRGTVETAGDIAVEDGVIRAVGPRGVAGDWRPDRVIDATGKVVLPGLINTHTHAAMTLFRSYADDLPLMEWLRTKIWPAEANLTAEDVYWGTMLAILEMIRGGTTTFADMYFFMEEVAKAVAETGVRAVLARGMIGVGPTADKALAESRAFVTGWHGTAGGRITVKLGPHAPYTCPPAYLEKVMALAAELAVGIHIHLAETAWEVAECRKEYGKTPVQLVEDIGLLRFPVLAAHCVHLTQEDIAILAKRGVGVAHNPGSNMKLASGTAPVPALLKAGVPVGLGTDGAASNNNLDMLEELRLAALLHKVTTGESTVISAGQALTMATREGARVLGLDDVTGSIVPGKQADIIIMDFAAPHLAPQHDLASLLTYAAAAADVETVIIAGRVVMENREVKTIDSERVLYEARRRAARLVSVN